VAPKPARPRRDPHHAGALVVLNHWANKLFPGRKPLLDRKRRARVEARLAEGFTVEQLCRAVDGVTESDWHMGRDPKTEGKSYRDVGVIFRDAAQVEKFLELADRVAPRPPQAPPGPPARAPLARPCPPAPPRGSNLAEAAAGLFAVAPWGPPLDVDEELSAALLAPMPPHEPYVTPDRTPAERAALVARQRAGMAALFPDEFPLPPAAPEEPSA